MINNEKWWLVPIATIMLFFLFREGGIKTLSHPYLFNMFVGVIVFLLAGFFSLFIYSSKKSSTTKDRNLFSSAKKIKRKECAELLASKGYQLYRGTQMIYNVAPWNGYHQDCVFSHKDLSKVYEFALKAEDISNKRLND